MHIILYMMNDYETTISINKNITYYQFREIWMLIIGFTLWYVWKARCLKAFQALVRPPEESIMGIWFMIIRCLQGQLDEVSSHSNEVLTTYLHF